ncbi:CYP5206 protein [Phycomyces blakesleeanus NRRL 1555(-)]|uniref:CYP5206 protein n=1 Tax=Phycomyces blakesleeanus (strain ATCC 8743b / DSM 1359 / FGSC 10004 / NBRC 33097 / NRRL 1555) TaxID=763407 RepID=A0A162UPF7_PHYB8|nr:CYP5206 protein [Phycomyces blakesleeanus NRRL 1555(-)]OAD76813.1 CYP5206 protein [Phycomyces blakesleeanus NRRL 1555(-)]|eukprot:XP_018294853.1 CYP5206 protein [Phycomyces blakesleeanus NRRL 1555(-)]
MEHSRLRISVKEKLVNPLRRAVTAGVLGACLYKSYSLILENQENTSVWDRRGFKKIPSPSERYFYIGHFLSFREQPNIQLQKWHKKYGPLIHLNMGAQHWIMISDPYIAHEIFVKNGAKTSGRHEHSFSYEKYAKAGSGIIFSHPGKKLNSALANAMRILSHQNVDQCIEEFEFTAETTLAQMMEATEREGSVDPSIYLKLGAYNTLIKAIFGRNISSINDPVFKDLLQVTQNVLQCSSPHRDIKSLFPRLAWLECLIGNNKKKEKIVSSRDELYGRLLKEALDGDADCLAKEIYLLKEEQELEEKDLIVMLSKCYS